MGQLFDKSIRKGFSDIFDSAYGTSALENRLKGALASSMYDARLSSAGYNKARTKTVEDELANRQSLRGRLVEGGDANALDRFDMGPGHAQDYMKGRVGARKDAQLVGELERLEGLGTPKAMDYRSGAITGSNRGSIGAGRFSEEKSAIARETQDKVTDALGVMKSADRSTPQGQKLYQDALTEALMLTEKTGNLSSIQQIESKIGATQALTKQRESKGLAALGSMESQKQYREEKIRIQEDFNNGRLDTQKIKAAAYADWKSAESLLANEKMQVQKAKVHEIEISALLNKNKIDKVKAEIKNANSKTKAEIKRIDQLVNSGTIKDLEVRENTRLIGERMKTEVKKREKMSATIDKLHKQGDQIDALIEKTRAQTKGEEVDMGLAFMEFLGLDTKTASGDSMRNNYTKMYVKIMKEDPILREKDPDNPGQERDIVVNRTDDNPDGQKKLFSHLNAEKQKIYIQSRLIDERQESYAMTGKTLHPKVQALVDGMMESFTNESSTGVADHLGAELNNMDDGEEKSDNYAIAPQGVRDSLLKAPLPQLDSNLGNPQISDDDIAAAMSGGGAAASQSIEGQADPLQEAIQSQGANTDISDLQGTQQKALPAGDLAAGQEEEKALSLQKMVTSNGWSANIATLFSELIATKAMSPVAAEKLSKMSVVQLQALVKNQKDDKQFSTDIMPIVQAMIKEKS